MATILMFGATGQVARCLLDRVATTGHVITALSRADVDLMDEKAIAEAIASAPDNAIVVNAAAYTAVDQAETDQEAALAINARAPGAMAQACAARDLPLIHISTDYVFDGNKSDAYVEDDPTDPQGVYGKTKRAGELAVLEGLPNAVILRTAWVYSPYGKNFVKTMLRVGAEREELGVVDDQLGCPTSAHDIADGILAVIDHVPVSDRVGGLYHLAGTGEASWADLADAVFEMSEARMGRRPLVKRISSDAYPTPAKRPANSRLSSSRFEMQFGYRAPHWRDSLQSVLEALSSAEASA
ncbi:dTDP-4-dehydrorhamnose reductase [Maricaulis parjimensis]|uniref:dTDP-4-dehydrorhamnose reductase n=1 Tax=Maricaulis parjimensis TaxID=144023 RepID=UPI001939DA43|nr:dTDP-4-dehydrorhamnose reductase [Maricaulis parjimensis]